MMHTNLRIILLPIREYFNVCFGKIIIYVAFAFNNTFTIYRNPASRIASHCRFDFSFSITKGCFKHFFKKKY